MVRPEGFYSAAEKDDSESVDDSLSTNDNHGEGDQDIHEDYVEEGEAGDVDPDEDHVEEGEEGDVDEDDGIQDLEVDKALHGEVVDKGEETESSESLSARKAEFYKDLDKKIYTLSKSDKNAISNAHIITVECSMRSTILCCPSKAHLVKID